MCSCDACLLLCPLFLDGLEVLGSLVGDGLYLALVRLGEGSLALSERVQLFLPLRVFVFQSMKTSRSALILHHVRDDQKIHCETNLLRLVEETGVFKLQFGQGLLHGLEGLVGESRRQQYKSNDIPPHPLGWNYADCLAVGFAPLAQRSSRPPAMRMTSSQTSSLCTDLSLQTCAYLLLVCEVNLLMIQYMAIRSSVPCLQVLNLLQ